MRKCLRIGIHVALLAAFVLASGVVAQEKEGKPQIVIEEMRHDLGEVFETKAYKHQFKVKNTGTADLEIKQVKPG